MILGKSTVVSKIAENLKEDFSEGKEESKIKKIKRFFNKKISEDMYIFFIESVLKKFKAEDNKVVVIFDHTTCEDRFVILSFMLSIGKRGIALYYKVYDYKNPNNKSMKDVKEGLERVKKILQPYGYEVTVLADRGFGSTELFEYIDKMGWTYFIRVKGNYNIRIKSDEVIGKIEDIEHPRGFTRYFYNVELTQSKYECKLEFFQKEYGEKQKRVVKKVEEFMVYLEPLFELPAEIRKCIYTTNAIESVNSALRKATKGKGAFPSESSVYKVMFLRIRELSEKWKKPMQNWETIRKQLISLFGDRHLNYVNL